MNTRAQEKLFLLDHFEGQIVGAKLPSHAQVLRVLFYNMRIVKLDLRTSVYLVEFQSQELINVSQNLRLYILN